ncbi:M20/M25/M40 family metallo-hydrolase [Wenjunlia tyrosinilytica]|uniref:Glutamate carboxypeptidase n=1 Tax=Wenjunlia tyrosinilytica TaxID=1544741 RepID=A0A917ZU55_9ACTN|nr:M20/M25/M40 family metallo-hydrolase [Wenjunlia tyrosinilytica]GGO93132.1 glutamate carboxypeptidase [Wenjunlia tyrosinilytica]
MSRAGGFDLGRAVERLRHLVGIESPSGHACGLGGCYELLTEWSRDLLGPPQCVVEGGVPHLYWEEAPAARGVPGVLLLGHADTVWPLGTLEGWPFTTEGERVSGPGVFDMKSGLVLALEALALAGDTRHVRMLVTGDEECGSLTSRGLVEEAARGCAAVLVLEPSMDGAVKTARKGGAIYRLDIRGHAAHAGLEPEKGVNALVELAHQVLAITALADADLGTSVTPTVGRAGTTTNTVPADAHINVDVRAWHRDELERVDANLRVLTSRVPGAAVELSGGINRLPLERSMSAGLLAVARQLAEAGGLGEVGEAAVGGASDGNFTAALGIPTLDGLGPRGAGAHARHEWADTGSFEERALLVAGLVRSLGPQGANGTDEQAR